MAKAKKSTKRSSAKHEIPEQAAMETSLVHGKPLDQAWDFGHHIVPPMSASVTYRLSSTRRGSCGFQDFASAAAHKHEPVFIYDRLDEPTRSMLESSLAHAEGGDFCCGFASGMAAVSAALGVCLHAGDHVIAHRTIYGCTYSLLTTWLTRFGVSVDFCDMRDPRAIAALVRPTTRVLYAETPVNPTLELIDIAALRAISDRVNRARKGDERPLRVIIDNTFATPYGQRPLALGAHVVCHSLTKNIGGFGTDMGGAVISRRELEGDVLVWRKDFGGVLASRVAWNILVYGLPTLPLRLVRQTETAMRVAQWLEQQPAVSRVVYPGLESFAQRELAQAQMRTPEGQFVAGNMIYFETREAKRGQSRNCERIVNHVARNAYSITLAVSLGQLRTLIESPGLMTHSALPLEEREKGGIAANGVRLSIGIEDSRDIIRDLKQAFAVVKRRK